MKYLIILAVVIMVIAIWRNARQKNDQSAENTGNMSKKKPSAQATEIVACAVCQIHLPRTEALVGPGGVYCSAAHRKQAGA